MTHVIPLPAECRRIQGVVTCSWFRRAIAALLFLVTALMPVTQAAAVCAGWSSSAVERMACCRGAEGHCAARSADDCCADRENRQHAETAGAITVTAAPMVARHVVAQPRPVRLPLVPPAASSRPDTYLLDSVFLI